MPRRLALHHQIVLIGKAAANARLLICVPGVVGLSFPDGAVIAHPFDKSQSSLGRGHPSQTGSVSQTIRPSFGADKCRWSALDAVNTKSSAAPCAPRQHGKAIIGCCAMAGPTLPGQPLGPFGPCAYLVTLFLSCLEVGLLLGSLIGPGLTELSRWHNALLSKTGMHRASWRLAGHVNGPHNFLRSGFCCGQGQTKKPLRSQFLFQMTYLSYTGAEHTASLKRPSCFLKHLALQESPGQNSGRTLSEACLLTWPILLFAAPDAEWHAGETVRPLVRQGMSCHPPRLQLLQPFVSMQTPQMTSSIWLPRWWQAPCWMLSLFWSNTQLKVSQL